MAAAISLAAVLSVNRGGWTVLALGAEADPGRSRRTGGGATLSDFFTRYLLRERLAQNDARSAGRGDRREGT